MVSACMHLHRVLHLETFVLEDVLGGAPVLLGTLGALSGHQWSSVVIRVHQCSSALWAHAAAEAAHAAACWST